MSRIPVEDFSGLAYLSADAINQLKEAGYNKVNDLDYVEEGDIPGLVKLHLDQKKLKKWLFGETKLADPETAQTRDPCSHSG